LPGPEFTGLPAFAGNDAVGRMTHRKAKAPPGNGFVMPAKAGIQYALAARGDGALSRKDGEYWIARLRGQ